MTVLRETFGRIARIYKTLSHHHPAPRIDRSFRKRADHQIAAHDDIQYTCHQQLDDLGDVDDAGADPRPEAVLGDGDVGVAHAYPLARRWVELVQALDQNFARVAADVRYQDHREDRPVAAAQHRERQRHDEHALRGSDIARGKNRS